MNVEAAAFVRNNWYVAATTAELTDRILSRRICGEPIVFFRRRNGSVAALLDRCPHRKYPLSKGRVVGDELQCGYHGIRFAGDGRCTEIPAQERVPRDFCAQSYAVHEGNALVFIWIGDAGKADPALIPDFSLHGASGWTTVYGYHRFAANYQLVFDNLMDLTHVQFIHKNLGGAGVANAPLEVAVQGEEIRTQRLIPNVDPAPIYRIVAGMTGKVDRWQKQIVQPPSYVWAELGARPTGTVSRPDEPRHVVLQGITAETERTTHYFWSVARNFALADEKLSKTFWDVTQDAFDEDVGALAAQQESIDADPTGEPLVALAFDKATVAARRIVARKLGLADARAAE